MRRAEFVTAVCSGSLLPPRGVKLVMQPCCRGRCQLQGCVMHWWRAKPAARALGNRPAGSAALAAAAAAVPPHHSPWLGIHSRVYLVVAA